MIGFFILSGIIGYLLGSINSSIIVGKIYGVDIRTKGSGNAGATNTLRTIGKKAALLVVIGDSLKGVLACLIASLICMGNGSTVEIASIIAGYFVILGHHLPKYFKFKGGKGVMTSFAVATYIMPLAAIITLLIFVLIVFITRYVSLGSMLGGISFTIISYFLGASIYTILFGVFISILIIIRHRANIKRLINGTESKLGQKKV